MESKAARKGWMGNSSFDSPFATTQFPGVLHHIFSNIFFCAASLHSLSRLSNEHWNLKTEVVCGASELSNELAPL